MEGIVGEAGKEEPMVDPLVGAPTATVSTVSAVVAVDLPLLASGATTGVAEAHCLVGAARKSGVGGLGEARAIAEARGAVRMTRGAGQTGIPQESRRGTSW